MHDNIDIADPCSKGRVSYTNFRNGPLFILFTTFFFSKPRFAPFLAPPLPFCA